MLACTYTIVLKDQLVTSFVDIRWQGEGLNSKQGSYIP